MGPGPPFPPAVKYQYFVGEVEFSAYEASFFCLLFLEFAKEYVVCAKIRQGTLGASELESEIASITLGELDKRKCTFVRLLSESRRLPSNRCWPTPNGFLSKENVKYFHS